MWRQSLDGPDIIKINKSFKGVILHSRRPRIFVENIEPRKERVHEKAKTITLHYHRHQQKLVSNQNY